MVARLLCTIPQRRITSTFRPSSVVRRPEPDRTGSGRSGAVPAGPLEACRHPRNGLKLIDNLKRTGMLAAPLAEASGGHKAASSTFVPICDSAAARIRPHDGNSR
jgi:hypothetical protein